MKLPLIFVYSFCQDLLCTRIGSVDKFAADLADKG